MTVPAPGGDPAGFQITVKDVWIEVMRMRSDLGPTMSNAAVIPDHETRLRKVEAWRYALPPAILLALGSTGIGIVELIKK